MLCRVIQTLAGFPRKIIPFRRCEITDAILLDRYWTMNVLGIDFAVIDIRDHKL
jgi:hypothetical protein